MAPEDRPNPLSPPSRGGVLNRDIPLPLGILETIIEAQEGATERVHQRRVNLGEFIKRKTPRFRDPKGNFEDGTLTGGAVATLAHILKDTSIPIGSDTELVDATVEPDGSVIYTVDVDAVLPEQARFQSKIESSNGYIGLLTDDIQVEGVEVLEKRPIRDTYRFKVRI